MANRKRVKVNKDHIISRRKHTKIWWVVLLVLFVFVFLSVLLLPVYMPTFASVSKIDIKTSERYIRESKLYTYLAMCGVDSDAVWDVPSNEVATCVKDKNVLIDDVKFAYWDGVLSVYIKQPHMIFSVKTDETVYFVSEDGRVYRIDDFDVFPDGLVQFYIPKTGTLSQIEVEGLKNLFYSVSCKSLFQDRGFPASVYIVGKYARLTYTDGSKEKVVIIPLYDLSACERVNTYWDKIWEAEGRYVDFSHRRIIVVKDTP